MFFIEQYIYEMGLEGLTWHGKNANFRCPICGDSKRSRAKKRGWIKLSKNSQYYVCCFNCGEYYPIISFMRLFYPPLYERYKKDNAKEFFEYRKKREKRIKEPITPIPEEEIIDNTIDLSMFRDAYKSFINSDFTIAKTKNTLVSINKLSDDQHAKEYVINRKLPKIYFDELCYTKSFMHLCNSISPKTLNGAQDSTNDS